MGIEGKHGYIWVQGGGIEGAEGGDLSIMGTHCRVGPLHTLETH